jgi:hypothetical protein
MSRSYTAYTCSNGACTANSGSESSACFRNTDGASCDDFNSCTYTSSCSGGTCVGSRYALGESCLDACECQSNACAFTPDNWAFTCVP